MAALDQLVQALTSLIDSALDITLTLLSREEWPARCLNKAIEWREMLHSIHNKLDVLQHVEIISFLRNETWHR